MPKSKRGPALVEVIRQGKIKQFGDSQLADSRPVRTEVHASPDSASPAPPSPSAPRWFTTQGDRIRFSLSTVALAMLLFGALVVVGTAFGIGRYLGKQAGATSDLHMAGLDLDEQFRELREQPAHPDVIEDLDRVTQSVLIEQTRKIREQHQDQDGFIDDLNYIWIERFNSQSDAQAGQTYLSESGVASTIIQQSGKWLLISKDGFDYRVPQEKQACQQLSEQIRQIGKQYFKAGGRYRFDGFVKKKLAGHDW